MKNQVVSSRAIFCAGLHETGKNPSYYEVEVNSGEWVLVSQTGKRFTFTSENDLNAAVEFGGFISMAVADSMQRSFEATEGKAKRAAASKCHKLNRMARSA